MVASESRPVAMTACLLAVDFSRPRPVIGVAGQTGVGGLRRGATDRHFVPNTSIGPDVFTALREYLTLLFTVVVASNYARAMWGGT
jgi:pentose-5-phosphate-3-epimerase